MADRVKFKDLSPEEQQDHRDRMRHSAAHVLAEAVTKIFPDAQLTIGPPIEDGFYYDFANTEPFTPDDLMKIELEMRDSIRANTEFVERETSRDEALDIVIDNPYKVEILEGIPADERVTFCSHSEGAFEDLCRGGHMTRTGDIKAYKLLSAAGAYWRGDEENAMLQRIYGTAWESRDAQKTYLKKIEEAEKRDHRKLGRALDLFFFDPIAPASPFFMPKGTVVLNSLITYVKELYEKYDYDEVMTPQIFNTDLWEKSGHLQAYSENMFFIDVDERQFGVKPMNCPAHAMMYQSNSRSYRELPLRWADFGRLHRNERSGVTAGLTRVRSLVQDDAHIFCTFEQIGQEISSFLKMLNEAYAAFGFDNYRFELSLRPDKRVGSDEMWDKAEVVLTELLDSSGMEYTAEAGEGAFYGPKIDVFIPDALGRDWQCGTVQLDFSLPERFDLEYAAEDGSRQRPVVVHRAMYGSLERFLGVLIEHLSGVFPLWLAPVQAVVVPIADRHNDFCHEVGVKFKAAGIRIKVDDSNDRMNAKIRQAQLQKIPYMLVVGDREVEAGTLAVRTRTGENLDPMSVDEAVAKFLEQIADKS
ncbi:MAG TPA: threonine--tRNA ligase [Dehalococcoidia bacterium]|jgi:threonyl-tRNA synthetase|nr:threonine--tRNA ligase [Dehalococcoidia bacterium]MDP7261557.1 threonine--tRNA ligase [Dehalococcoidia bacterium]MDP7485343.1 threonine--tRNA ligase [Dehalococcoidia bacterium]HJP27447.1 threonine--tRNA ligase [Dehalococcoidia bacterium]|tara:strand:- start:755 stop:2515 length:1761 start_codon:yes stop_codon:yes gene_type:complete